MTTDEADGKTGLKTVFNVCCRASTLSNTKIQKKRISAKTKLIVFPLYLKSCIYGITYNNQKECIPERYTL